MLLALARLTYLLAQLFWIMIQIFRKLPVPKNVLAFSVTTAPDTANEADPMLKPEGEIDPRTHVINTDREAPALKQSCRVF